MTRAHLTTASVGLFLLAAPAAAQPSDPAHVEARLRRWTEATRELRAQPLPNEVRLRCAGRPRSCECGGLPIFSPGGDPELERNFRAVNRAIVRCAERRLRGESPSPFAVQLEVTVAAGRVTAARILEDTSGDARLGRCVLRAVRRLRFPRSAQDRAPVTVVLPLVFGPTEPPDAFE